MMWNEANKRIHIDIRFVYIVFFASTQYCHWLPPPDRPPEFCLDEIDQHPHVVSHRSELFVLPLPEDLALQASMESKSKSRAVTAKAQMLKPVSLICWTFMPKMEDAKFTGMKM